MTCGRNDLPALTGVGVANSTVAFDFDGVLAEIVWPDRNKIGAPIQDGIAILKHYAALGHNCVIYTARRTDDKQMIWDWVKELQLPIEEVHCGAKPIAGLYIDDRAWRFPTGRHVQSREFHGILTEVGELHDKKQLDYGSDTDPFANVRASEDFGVPGWKGALLRANDKMVRLKNFSAKGELANESVEDSMLDLAVYALIGLVLYRGASAPPKEEKEQAEPAPVTMKWDASEIKRLRSLAVDLDEIV